MAVYEGYMNELLKKFKDKSNDIEDFPESYPSSADAKWEACIKKLFNKKRSKKFVIAALLGSCNVMADTNKVKEYCKDLKILTTDAVLKNKDYIKEADALRKSIKKASKMSAVKDCLVKRLPEIEDQLKDIKLFAKLLSPPTKKRPPAPNHKPKLNSKPQRPPAPNHKPKLNSKPQRPPVPNHEPVFKKSSQSSVQNSSTPKVESKMEKISQISAHRPPPPKKSPKFKNQST